MLLEKDGLRCWRRPELQCWSESVWIEVPITGSSSLICGCIYRPPSTSASGIDEFARCLESSFDSIDVNCSRVM